MRKMLLISALLTFVSVFVSADEGDTHIAFGLEGNLNGNMWAFGQSVYVDFQFLKPVVMGLSLTVSDDFKRVMVIEPAFFVRWYPHFGTSPLFNIKDGGLFLQGDIGVSAALGSSDRSVSPKFLVALLLGFRFPFAGGDYFAEPFVKGGYPFRFGAGVKFGCRF